MIDRGWFSSRSVEPTGPFLEGSCVPLTTHCRIGRAFETPRNGGVMSSIAWLTRLSAKAHFSTPLYCGCGSDACDVAGDSWPKRLEDDELCVPSSRTM